MQQIDWTQTKLPLTAAQALDAAKLAKLQEINAACDKAVGALTATYPQSEIQSWPQQVKEAGAYAKDPITPVPLLETIAIKRGLGIAVLVARVHAKVGGYAVASGALIGKRQALEDAIDAAGTVAQVQSVVWSGSDPG